mgnify:CR=1 FL=1
MPKIAMLNQEGAKVGEIELSEAIFASEINESVLHLVVRSQLAAKRQGTQSAKTRGEVRGGGRKIYRQKGTGNARHHGNRAPQFTHGGVVFAPKPRDYSYTLNKKVKRLALKSALSAKAAAGEILVVDGMAVEEIKTAPVKAFLTKIGADGKALLVTEQVDEKLVKSSRNIPGVSSTIATILSPYMILTHRVLVVDKAALQKIEEVYA